MLTYSWACPSASIARHGHEYVAMAPKAAGQQISRACFSTPLSCKRCAAAHPTIFTLFVFWLPCSRTREHAQVLVSRDQFLVDRSFLINLNVPASNSPTPPGGPRNSHTNSTLCARFTTKT